MFYPDIYGRDASLDEAPGGRPARAAIASAAEGQHPAQVESRSMRWCLRAPATCRPTSRSSAKLRASWVS